MPDPKLERIKELTIIALVSDDELMDRLVLKGGNAIRLAHQAHVRQSLDLDFSVAGDLDPIGEMKTKIEGLLKGAFESEELVPFDVEFFKAPPNLAIDTIGDFWGGYKLEFKVISKTDFDRLAAQPDRRSTQAMALGKRESRVFSVDISKHEYVDGKIKHELDGYTVFMYSPLMIVCEKIRAICQQMQEYRKVVQSSSARPRARDFFDIHYLTTTDAVNISSEDFWKVLVEMFRVKRVPLHLIGQISSERDFHRQDFQSVRDTVRSGHPIKEFDFYCDFLVTQLQPLEARWKVDTPLA